MHSTPRTTLLGTLLAIGMSVGRIPELPKAMAAAFRDRHSPLPTKGRTRLPRGGRIRPPKERLFCKADGSKPAKYTQASPKTVTGVRLRWQNGQLVPRATPQALPLRRRQAERLVRKERLARERSQQGPVKRRPVKHGGYRRDDMKGAMRAARRARIITARQQRLIHRGIRAGGYAPEKLLQLLQLEDRRNPEVLA